MTREIRDGFLGGERKNYILCQLFRFLVMSLDKLSGGFRYVVGDRFLQNVTIHCV